jgi:glyoxylase-like metal-dependent hydrolase (beta-lactamase superfamily II)
MARAVPDSRFQQLTEHVDWFTPDDRTDRPALGAVHGRDATLLVEGGASAAHLSAFLAELATRERPPVTAIALTHWHWDHSFGSAAAGAAVLAHVGGDHSADSCVVHIPGDDVLFLGDCLYQRLHAPEPLLTVAGVRALLDALERFPVAAAVEGHGDEVLDATAYAARLNELRQAADLVDARGPAAVDDAADDPELRELVEFLLVGAGARQ